MRPAPLPVSSQLVAPALKRCASPPDEPETRTVDAFRESLGQAVWNKADPGGFDLNVTVRARHSDPTTEVVARTAPAVRHILPPIHI